MPRTLLLLLLIPLLALAGCGSSKDNDKTTVGAAKPKLESTGQDKSVCDHPKKDGKNVKLYKNARAAKFDCQDPVKTGCASQPARKLKSLKAAVYSDTKHKKRIGTLMGMISRDCAKVGWVKFYQSVDHPIEMNLTVRRRGYLPNRDTYTSNEGTVSKPVFGDTMPVIRKGCLYFSARITGGPTAKVGPYCG